MNKALLALATAAAFSAATLTAPGKAEARCFGCAVGAGIVAGALIGTALAASAGHYRGAYYARPRGTARVPPDKPSTSGMASLGPMGPASGGTGTASLGPMGSDTRTVAGSAAPGTTSASALPTTTTE